jgi:hypothetical protein
VFKKLYKNSGREKGTLRFFREKLNRRNVTADVKHYEDCEQLFLSVGKCFVIEALLEFFQMNDAKCKPTANGPHSVHIFQEDYQKSYFKKITRRATSLVSWTHSWMSLFSVMTIWYLVLFS